MQGRHETLDEVTQAVFEEELKLDIAREAAREVANTVAGAAVTGSLGTFGSVIPDDTW